MKISPPFTHPQAILVIYDFLLSEESNRSYIKKHPCFFKFYNGSEWVIFVNSPKEVKLIASIHNKTCLTRLRGGGGGGGGGVNKGLL